MSTNHQISQFTICPYRGEDEDEFLSLWNRNLRLDPIDKRGWRQRFLLDPHFDPSCCLLARKGTQLVGFLFGIRPFQSTEAWIVAFGVDREFRRLGLATMLLDAVTEYWVNSGANRIVVGPYVPAYIFPGVDELNYADAICWLIANGYQVESRPISMIAELTAPQQLQPEPANGIMVRAAEPTDILRLLALLTAEFPHWKSEVLPVMEDQFTSSGRATTLFIAIERGEVIGFAQSRSERFGPFGVAASHRGRGVGGRLLDSTLSAMMAQGFRVAWFLWTDESAARLYRRHGFVTFRTFAIMSREQRRAIVL